MTTRRFPIVAIGASAGDLEPVETLLHAMPMDCGLAFVVIRRLPDDFNSQMVELLSRATGLSVVRAEQGMEVKADCVYLIPANAIMTIQRERLQMLQRSMPLEPALPIDTFMVSLATDVGDRAIGVVLSGTGTDGAVGVQAISSMGGWVLVQDEESSRFDDMPMNAIASGTADVIGSPAMLADALCHPSTRGWRDMTVASGPLAGVTRFFRDPEAFDSLDRHVLEALMADARESKKLRVWVCGAGSGEEAYSLAMLIDERLATLDTVVEFKLFATDVHQGFLERANIGFYTAEALDHLSKERREKYFLQTSEGYQVTSELRSMIVFTEHNVLRDLPFTQLDLVTCRNLLIYLQPDAQLDALSLLHFGLKPGGYLFLGPSETTASLKEEFETIDPRWRVYRKRRNIRLPTHTKRPLSLSVKKPVSAFLPTTGRRNQPPDPLIALHGQLLHQQEVLQSTIEELESSNEELRSVNEELYSVNSRHQRNIQELSLANDDMTNLLAITRVGVLFLDEGLRIRRYTPEMGRFFSLMPQDLGRSISDFNHSLDYRNVMDDLEHSIDSGEQVERSVQDSDGTPYLLRITPYHRREEVSGAALMLIDISAMANAQKEIATYRYLSDQTVIGQVLVNQNGRIHFANPAFCRISEKSTSELQHSTIHDLFPGLDRGTLRGFFEQPLETPVKPFESALLLASGQSVPVELSPNLLTVEDRTLLFIAVQDITERHRAAQRTKLYESAIEATDSGISIADARAPDLPLIYVNKAFRNMTGYTRKEILGKNCRLLQGTDTDPASVETLRSGISAEAPVRTVFLNYDKHGQPFWNDLIINPVTNEDGETTHFVGVANDVTERVEDAIRLKGREAQVSAIVNATDQAIFGVDTGLRVTFVNSAALELVGLSIEEIISDRRLDELLDLAALGRDQDGHVNLAQQLSSAVTGGQSIRYDPITLSRADGAMVSAEISTNPVTQSLEVSGAVVTIKNVTEQEAQSQLLTRALEQADQASRAKSDFLANMSHEIRTPLTAVMGFADLMAMSLEDQEQLDNARAIKQNALHLLDLVNDILDLSKLESARLSMDSELVSLPVLVAGLRSMHKMRAEQKNLNFSFLCLTPIPQKIRTDPVRIRQVLVNLISNALKFTEQGSVDVEFEIQDGKLNISVRDTGPGIAEDQLNDMFLPFRQGTLGVRRGGTGLGLSISKHLMELLGGELTVQSQPGHGSVFRVSIRVQAEAGQRMITEFVETKENGTRCKDELTPTLSGNILVAEDSLDVQKIINRLLTRAGARVTCVSDGIKALEAIRQQPDGFDLVLLDIRMPRLGGEEVVRQLRESGFSKPVVAITAHAMAGDHERYREIGFVDSLSKPIDAQLLLSRLAALMDLDCDLPVDVLLVEDHDQSRQVLVKLLEKLGYAVKAAANGSEALSLLRQCKPRLCLIDMGLPDMGGLDVVAANSADNEETRVRFVAMTGSISQNDRKAYKDAGIEQVLAKPVDMAEVRKLLASLQDVERLIPRDGG